MDWRAFVMEIAMTAILVSVILHTATGGTEHRHDAAFAVGWTVALLELFASPISGSSMNPARTLGSDMVGVNFTGWWVYVFGELIGAAIAVVIIILVRGGAGRGRAGGGRRWRAAALSSPATATSLRALEATSIDSRG